MTVKILSLSGSPVRDSSTDILLSEIAGGIIEKLPEICQFDLRQVRLNDFVGIPCQACGDAPMANGNFCFYEDEISSLYNDLATCDCVLFGSPVYFDSVSAQAKLFIDRCNCFRPADFKNLQPEHDFIKRLTHKRPGAMVLVGGGDGGVEGARRTIAGWFKWVEVRNEGKIYYDSPDFNKRGTVRDDAEKIAEARALGNKLAGLALKASEETK